MSDPENFLSRWSRRKQEAERTDPPAETVEPTADAPSPAGEAGDGQPEGEAASEVDLTKLPAVDSIDAATDIRGFLEKGIPAGLTREALRRAWAADPAIRDFIGIAENQWDFATGKDLPGFGPLDATPDQLRQMVADVFESQLKPEPELPKPVEEAAPAPSADAPAEQQQQQLAALDAVPNPQADVGEENIAPQQNADAEDAAPPPRSHGGALPQ